MAEPLLNFIVSKKKKESTVSTVDSGKITY